MEVADGAGTTGQGWQRGGGTHPCHGIGHCGEITPLIGSLAIVHKVFVIAQVCQRERCCMEASQEGGGQTNGRKVGAKAKWSRKDATDEEQPGKQIKEKGRGTKRRNTKKKIELKKWAWKAELIFLPKPSQKETQLKFFTICGHTWQAHKHKNVMRNKIKNTYTRKSMKITYFIYINRYIYINSMSVSSSCFRQQCRPLSPQFESQIHPTHREPGTSLSNLKKPHHYLFYIHIYNTWRFRRKHLFYYGI